MRERVREIERERKRKSELVTHPELVVLASGPLLDERSIVGGDVSVVGELWTRHIIIIIET